MAAGRHRLPARLVLALVVAGLAVTFGALDVQAAAPAITITAHVGYSDTIRTGQWMPISIVVTNNGPQVDGTLAVQSTFGSKPGAAWPATYERPVVIAAGTTKSFRTYLDEESAGLTVTVRVIRNGQIIASQDAAGTRAASTLIGVLSDDSTALDDFAVVHPGSLTPSVVHLALADIADSGIALRAFDLLAVDDYATDGLSASQRTAIADYVENGGAFLVGTGASWRRTLAGLPTGLLPMRADGLTTLAGSPSLAGLGEVQVATGSLTGGTVWLGDGVQPLLAERSVGLGSTTLATFDWKQEPIAGWSGTRSLLRQVLVRTLLGGQSQQSAGQSNLGAFAGPIGSSAGSIFERSGTLSQVLGNLPALDLPSLALTGALVLFYVLLVGPINFFVLGALHKRALAWITLPLIAVLVAGGAYGGGILTKGQSVQINQVSILHVVPGSDRGYLETYTGVLAPTRGDYQVSLGRHGQLVSPITSYDFNGYGGAGQADIRVNVEDGGITLPGMTAFSLRGFATEGMTTVPNLTAHLSLVNGQLVGSIVNQSSTNFSDAIIIDGEGYQKLGALAPGGTASVGFAPKTATFNGPPATLTIYPNYSLGPAPSQPSEAQRDGQARTQVLSLLSGGGFKGIPGSSGGPIVVAWTGQSPQAVTVNGAHPRTHSVGAVAMAVAVDEVGLGALPAGVVRGRVVDFEGDTQSGPSGLLLVQNGTVTLQFAPPLAAGLHLAAASLSSISFFSKGGPVGPNGGVSSVKGEAWDWSHSSWVDVAYQENAATALPEGTINPNTGEVRLKATVSNGSFLATGVSLTGTVQ